MYAALVRCWSPATQARFSISVMMYGVLIVGKDDQHPTLDDTTVVVGNTETEVIDFQSERIGNKKHCYKICAVAILAFAEATPR